MSGSPPPDDAAPDVRLLAARVDELTATLARVTADLEDLTAAILPTEYAPPDDDPPDPLPTGPAPVYDTLEDWVSRYFTPTFRRAIGGDIRWCSQWTEHPEALTRLEALWRSWETLRLDPNLGIATWLTTYLDPQLVALTNRSGTFASCTPDRHAPISYDLPNALGRTDPR